MQPGGVPNAGSGYIDSIIPNDAPRRTVLWVVGFSTFYHDPVSSGDLTFILLRVPDPPPVGVYPIRALADSTVFLEGYGAAWVGREFDMSDVGFVTEPFTGEITIEESDASGVVGRFSLNEGRYLFDDELRCMSASGRFSTRQR
jgi:hypothetical protein